MGSWAEDTDDESRTWLGITTHTSTQDLLLLSRGGALLKLSRRTSITKLVPVCSLKLPSNIQGSSHKVTVFSHGVMFGIIDCNSIVYIYDIVSGKLLQTLQEFSSERLQVLSANCKQTIFWTLNGIWELNCIPLNELVKTVTCRDLNGETLPKETIKEQEETEFNSEVDHGTPQEFQLLDFVTWLCVFGLKHSALVLLLEYVISCTGKGDKVPETTLHLLKHLGKDVLQSPSVLLTLFEDDLELREASRDELKAFLEEIDQAMVPSEFVTTLNLKILPFLRELYERWSEQMIVPSVDLSRLSEVLEENKPGGVIHTAAQSVVTGALDAMALERMEIMSLQEPQQAVKAFVGDGGNLLLGSEEHAISHLGAVLR